MKKKNLKLRFSKETIAKLNSNEMQNVRGGSHPGCPTESCQPCFAIADTKIGPAYTTECPAPTEIRCAPKSNGGICVFDTDHTKIGK